MFNMWVTSLFDNARLFASELKLKNETFIYSISTVRKRPNNGAGNKRFYSWNHYR